MAEKKFAAINGTVDSVEVNADYEGAEKFGRLKVGKLGVYYKEGLKTRYIPYGQLERAFIRIQQVNGKLCCGNGVFEYYHMIFVVSGKEQGDILSEELQPMQAALAAIAKAAPQVAIGVNK